MSAQRLSSRLSGVRRHVVLIALALLAGLVALPGCHDAAEDDSAPPAFRAQSDKLPAGLPAASPLFAAVVVPPDPHRVDHAVLPPEPPDADQVAQEAVQATPAPRLPASPAPGSIGLLVCDPVTASPAPAALADFGVGCGHWLHLIAAGQPEFGRTAMWEARTRIERELGRTDLRLTPAVTPPLASMAGVTHVACGTLSGTPSRCTLSYQLYTLPNRRPLGTPLTVTGSWAQVAASLPVTARGLDARLGLTAAPLPASVGLSPNDLAWLGAMTHGPNSTDADLLALAKMSARAPLAGFFLLQTRAMRDQIVQDRTVKTLLTQTPQNALVINEIGYKYPEALRPYAAATAALFLRYPGSALLAHTEAWEQRVWGTRSGELRATLRVAADSPQDPDSWLSPAQTLSNIAQDLRQGRFANDLSPREWAYLNHLYPQAEADAATATRLDPKDAHAWGRLAADAAFAGDSSGAVAAFQRAEALDPAEVDAWGLEMFQPKWYSDPAALDRVAARAAARRYDDADSAIEIAGGLNSAGQATKDPKYAALAAGVMARIIAQDRALAAKNPADSWSHWDLAGALAYGSDPASLREATREYRIAAHLLPNSPQLHYWLADTLDKRHKDQEEIPELRQAVALDPFYTRAHFDLGYVLKHTGHFPEALTELRLAMRLDPRDPNAHFGLGDLLMMQHQPAPAVTEYREAARMSPYFARAWGGLCNALNQTGHYDESLKAGQQAVHVDEVTEGNDTELMVAVHDAMADDELHRKDWEASLAETQEALKINAHDAVAQENIAEAYWGQGRAADARAQWEHVIALGDPQMVPVARKLLAAHP